MKIAIINGPNLNMLGKREKDHYGGFSLGELENYLKKEAPSDSLLFFQSNHEGQIVEFIHNLENEKVDAIIVNAGAYTHTSIALRDAFLSVKIPFVEVHISNVYAREDFRKLSYLSDIAAGVIAGLGKTGYKLAIEYFRETL
ncbi:MAG: type II 3-dehydroquinate dehydratase [Spirochaetia bacterium]|nr:type II 3-dehydroquinate dehydratase [Spirochaetia bacterium]